MDNRESPLVSVCMITYNHVNFISQAITGVLDQKTIFPLELIIGEDCSKDGTRMICEEYARKYNQINLLPSKTNLGMIANFIRTLNSCNGKYIALCEGDDYWIDPFKLQKQIDFLDANPEIVLSGHNAKIINEIGESIGLFNKGYKKEILDINDIIVKWQIPSASIVFRRDCIHLPEWIIDVPNGDLALQLILAGKGKFNYINEVMSVYRKHETGSSTLMYKNIISYWERHKFLWEKINEYYNYKYDIKIKKNINFANKHLLRQKLLHRFSFLRFLKKIYKKINPK